MFSSSPLTELPQFVCASSLVYSQCGSHTGLSRDALMVSKHSVPLCIPHPCYKSIINHLQVPYVSKLKSLSVPPEASSKASLVSLPILPGLPLLTPEHVQIVLTFQKKWLQVPPSLFILARLKIATANKYFALHKTSHRDAAVISSTKSDKPKGKTGT